jgi:hypothetical protein
MVVSFAQDSAGCTRAELEGVKEHVVVVPVASSLARHPSNTLLRGPEIAWRNVAKGREGFLAILAAWMHWMYAESGHL